MFVLFNGCRVPASPWLPGSVSHSAKISKSLSPATLRFKSWENNSCSAVGASSLSAAILLCEHRQIAFCTSLASVNWYNGNSNKTKWQMNVRFTDMSRDHSVWVNITQRLGVWGLEAESQGSYSGSATFTSCVILGKLLKLPVPQFPCLWNGYKNSTFCRGWQED